MQWFSADGSKHLILKCRGRGRKGLEGGQGGSLRQPIGTSLFPSLFLRLFHCLFLGLCLPPPSSTHLLLMKSVHDVLQKATRCLHNISHFCRMHTVYRYGVQRQSARVQRALGCGHSLQHQTVRVQICTRHAFVLALFPQCTCQILSPQAQKQGTVSISGVST